MPAAVSKMPAPRVAQVEAGGAVLPELRAVDLGHAEQVADHPEGDLEAEPFDEVDHRAVGGHVVERGIDDAVDVVLEVRQPAAGEQGVSTPRRRPWSGWSVIPSPPIRSAGARS